MKPENYKYEFDKNFESKERISIYVPHSIKEKLECQANEKHRTVSKIGADIIKEYFKNGGFK